MKFIRKWLLRALERARDEQYAITDSKQAALSTMAGSNSVIAMDDVPLKLAFNVVPATGGVVVSINKWDRQQGRHTETVHVIHDDDEIATNIGHIVSMELLRAR